MKQNLASRERRGTATVACFSFHLTGCWFCAPPSEPAVLEIPSTQCLGNSPIDNHSLNDLT